MSPRSRRSQPITPRASQSILRRASRGRVLLALAAATLLSGALALPSLETMSDRGAGVIEFELAGSSSKAEEIVDQWGEEGRSAARESLLLDYPFLVFYGLLYAGGCIAVSERARRLGWSRAADLGILLAWAGLAAAACDAVENVALLGVAAEHTDQPLPAIALAFASVKFALSTAVIVYGLGGWAATALKRA